jgi:hypothetical protein
MALLLPVPSTHIAAQLLEALRHGQDHSTLMCC